MITFILSTKVTAPITNCYDSDRWRPNHLSAVCPWSRHLHRRRPVDAGARQSNSVAVLRCSPPIAPDPPSGANSHIPDTRNSPSEPATRLRQSELVGITTYLVRRLQSVLNETARLIYHLRPHDHITDALATLHWQRVPERVQYKIAVLTYKVLHDSAPQYLGPLVTVADLPGRRALWSASTSRLVIPPIKLSTVGSRAFPVDAAQVWNGLPEAVISSSSLQSFRRQLKTCLLSQYDNMY